MSNGKDYLEAVLKEEALQKPVDDMLKEDAEYLAWLQQQDNESQRYHEEHDK